MNHRRSMHLKKEILLLPIFLQTIFNREAIVVVYDSSFTLHIMQSHIPKDWCNPIFSTWMTLSYLTNTLLKYLAQCHVSSFSITCQRTCQNCTHYLMCQSLSIFSLSLYYFCILTSMFPCPHTHPFVRTLNYLKSLDIFSIYSSR